MPAVTKPSITALALALALTACGDSPKPTSNPDDALAASAVTATAGAMAGGVTGVGVSTDDLPDFVELPPGAKAIHNMKLNDGGKIGGTVSLEVRQTPAEVLTFYKQVFARHGLNIAIETLSTDVAMLNGQSPDESKMLHVMINKVEDGPTALNIVHARKTI
jgi:hypothetical protein